MISYLYELGGIKMDNYTNPEEIYKLYEQEESLINKLEVFIKEESKEQK